MNELVTEKKRIEAEIEAFAEYLKSQNVGMDDPLIDRQGFPRADIDVYQVRHARSSIKRLANDHKEIMKQIDQMLLNIHQNKGAQPVQGSEEVLPPFAYVNTVEANSPASTAGLEKNDKILKFGHITFKNNQQLKALGELVMNSEGKMILVKIERRTDEGVSNMQLQLTPQKWAGRGLLGCHILPLN